MHPLSDLLARNVTLCVRRPVVSSACAGVLACVSPAGAASSAQSDCVLLTRKTCVQQCLVATGSMRSSDCSSAPLRGTIRTIVAHSACLLQASSPCSCPRLPCQLKASSAHACSVLKDAGDLMSCSQVPPGCRRYSVELRKPLGMVLEEDRHGAIFVVRRRCRTTAHVAPLLGWRPSQSSPASANQLENDGSFLCAFNRRCTVQSQAEIQPEGNAERSGVINKVRHSEHLIPHAPRNQCGK